MENSKYNIREICGDWALDIQWGKETIVLIFNSRNNAEFVKKILEWEDMHPNQAVPYVPVPQPGNPLTLEQLREMDGQPVWSEDVERWALVSVDNVGGWKGVPFVLFMENGAKFNWNVEIRKLTLYSYPPAHIDRSGWISVKERLPKTGTVLVTDGKIVITAPSSSVTKDGLAITHWMPLPEPPEEG